MKEIKASLMVVVAVLGLIAFISPVSAYSITNGAVSYDAGEDETTWTFDVTCADSDPHAISHFTVAWCSEPDVIGVKINGVVITSWDYGGPDGQWNGIKGIKIDYQVDEGTTANVEIILSGQYGTTNVDYAIKAAGPTFPVNYGTVFGPSHEVPIPEFTTIAIPVATILGLLFFFNHRKHRKE
jgi:hypothetical protein